MNTLSPYYTLQLPYYKQRNLIEVCSREGSTLEGYRLILNLSHTQQNRTKYQQLLDVYFRSMRSTTIGVLKCYYRSLSIEGLEFVIHTNTTDLVCAKCKVLVSLVNVTDT